MNNRPSGKTAIVIVDTWKQLYSGEAEYKPYIAKDIAAVGEYISRVVAWEKYHKGTDCYIDPTGTPVIDVLSDLTELTNIADLVVSNTTYKNIYLCGMHMGRCINAKAEMLREACLQNDVVVNIGILVNLSMPFPANHDETARWNKYGASQDKINTYYWGYDSIVPVEFPNG